MLSGVAKGEGAALAEAGRFMLYEDENLTGAITYLKRALAAGQADAAIDLAVAVLFAASHDNRRS